MNDCYEIQNQYSFIEEYNIVCYLGNYPSSIGFNYIKHDNIMPNCGFNISLAIENTKTNSENNNRNILRHNNLISFNCIKKVINTLIKFEKENKND